MKDIDRIDRILEDIKTIWKTYPELRLGQLISNVVQDPILYYIDDEELAEDLKYFYLEQVGELNE